MSKNKIYLLSILLILSSCLKTEQLDVAKRVESFYKVNSFNQWIVQGSDSIRVNEVKFIIDDFTIITTDSVVIEKAANIPPLIYGYYEATTGDQLVFSVGLGFSDINGFEDYQIQITPASRQSPVNDSEFFGTNASYSIIIKGRYNSTNFIFRSSTNQNKEFNLSPVVLDDKKNVLVINNDIDIRDVFIAESDTLIDPTKDSNISLLSNRFINAIEVEFSRKSVILF